MGGRLHIDWVLHLAQAAREAAPVADVHGAGRREEAVLLTFDVLAAAGQQMGLLARLAPPSSRAML